MNNIIDRGCNYNDTVISSVAHDGYLFRGQQFRIWMLLKSKRMPLCLFCVDVLMSLLSAERMQLQLAVERQHAKPSQPRSGNTINRMDEDRRLPACLYLPGFDWSFISSNEWQWSLILLIECVTVVSILGDYTFRGSLGSQQLISFNLRGINT